ncbi:MAG: HNH endonuclease signature motif containing protein [Nitrosopumilus sp.]
MCFEIGINENELNECLNEINDQVSFHIEDNKSNIWVFVKNLLTELGYENSPLHLKSLKNRLKNDDIPEIIEQDVLNRYQNIIPTDRIINKVALSKKEVILIRDDFKCAYCGKNFKEIEDINLDHIIPRDAGGTDEYENLVSSCRRCNAEKLNLNPKDLEKTPQPKKFSKNDAIKKLKQPTVLSKYRELFIRFR